MKSIITVLAFTASLILVSFKANEEKQTLTVKYTVDEWQSKLNLLEAVKNVLKQSDVPSKVVTAVSDSLTKFQNEIAAQVTVQIKPDSTKKK